MDGRIGGDSLMSITDYHRFRPGCGAADGDGAVAIFEKRWDQVVFDGPQLTRIKRKCSVSPHENAMGGGHAVAGDHRNANG